MTSETTETVGKFEVGASDITITEGGGVEIVNVPLARALKDAFEGRNEQSRSNVCGNTIIVNGKNCPPKG